MNECLCRDIITILVEEKGMSLSAAFELLYNSDIYSKMSNPATGLFFKVQDMSFFILCRVILLLFPISTLFYDTFSHHPSI